MGFWTYWGRVLRLAVRQTWDATQSTVFGLALAIGIASVFLPRLASMQAVVNGWQAALSVLGVLILSRLMLAPYWLHQQVSRDLQRLRRDHAIVTMTPASKIHVEPSLGVTVTWREDEAGKLLDVMLIFDLSVRNITDEPLHDCQVWTRWAPTRKLDEPMWSDWLPSSGLFNLRPQEERKKPVFETPSDRAEPYIRQVLFHEEGDAWAQSVNMPDLHGEYHVEAEVRSMSTVPARTRLIAVPGHGPRIESS